MGILFSDERDKRDNPVIRGAKQLLNRGEVPETLLTPAEVASLFRVDPKTVTRWAKAGKLTAIRTLGGHRRYRQSEVQALISAQASKAEG